MLKDNLFLIPVIGGVFTYVVFAETLTRWMQRKDALRGVRASAVCQCIHTAYLHDHKLGHCTICMCPMFQRMVL